MIRSFDQRRVEPRVGFVAAATLVLLLCVSVGRAAVINVDFTPAFLAADDPTRKMAKVVWQARDNWQAAIAHPFVLDVLVDWGVPDQSACGQGGVLTTQMVADGLGVGGMIEVPATGGIVFNQHLVWFVDATPADSTEYDAVPGKPWRGTAKAAPGGTGGVAKDKVDLLSCAKHELGHTLGFHFEAPAAFPPYNAEVGDGAVDLIGALAGTAIPIGAGGNNAKSHYDPAGVVPGVPVADLLMVTGAPIPGDDRTFMSPWDVNGVAAILKLPAGSYDMEPKEVGGGIPEPGTALMLLCAGGILAYRRRRR